MRRYSMIMKSACIALPCLIFVSCAGVKCNVTAARIDQPVSFTPYVYGITGAVIRVSKQDTLKHFRIKKMFWAMLWRNINLTDNNWDLSDDLNREIAKVNGDAIANMTVLAKEDFLWYLASIVPIIPDFQTIVVEGDVVRLPEAKAR